MKERSIDIFQSLEEEVQSEEISSSLETVEEQFSEPLPAAIQSGRSKQKGKSTRGNHRSGLRGKGREAFNRNNWMKDVI